MAKYQFKILFRTSGSSRYWMSKYSDESMIPAAKGKKMASEGLMPSMRASVSASLSSSSTSPGCVRFPSRLAALTAEDGQERDAWAPT